MRFAILAIATVTMALHATAPALAHDDDKPGAHGPAEHAAALGVPGDPKAKARTVAINASDKMRFAPDRLVVKRGETIRFVVTNGGATKHELVLGTLRELREHAKLMQKFPEMVHDDPNAASVAPGQSSELLWKFTKTGEFYFACLVPGHFEAGMHGKIVVSR
jgi:uncharacterized cupredoxin-like copper-binding protein